MSSNFLRFVIVKNPRGQFLDADDSFRRKIHDHYVYSATPLPAGAQVSATLKREVGFHLNKVELPDDHILVIIRDGVNARLVQENIDSWVMVDQVHPSMFSDTGIVHPGMDTEVPVPRSAGSIVHDQIKEWVSTNRRPEKMLFNRYNALNPESETTVPATREGRLEALVQNLQNTQLVADEIIRVDEHHEAMKTAKPPDRIKEEPKKEPPASPPRDRRPVERFHSPPKERERVLDASPLEAERKRRHDSTLQQKRSTKPLQQMDEDERIIVELGLRNNIMFVDEETHTPIGVPPSAPASWKPLVLSTEDIPKLVQQVKGDVQMSLSTFREEADTLLEAMTEDINEIVPDVVAAPLRPPLSAASEPMPAPEAASSTDRPPKPPPAEPSHDKNILESSGIKDKKMSEPEERPTGHKYLAGNPFLGQRFHQSRDLDPRFQKSHIPASLRNKGRQMADQKLVHHMFTKTAYAKKFYDLR